MHKLFSPQCHYLLDVRGLSEAMLVVHIGLIHVVSFLLLDFGQSLLFGEEINPSNQFHGGSLAEDHRLIECLVVVLRVVVLEVLHALDVAVQVVIVRR